MADDRAAILAFMRQRSLAVEATVSPSGSPQAAAVGFIVTDDFEMFFDTLNSARKVQNLRSCPSGDDLARLKALYFARFPDGRDRERWKGITYVRVRPQWLRFSDYTQDPPTIIEMMFD